MNFCAMSLKVYTRINQLNSEVKELIDRAKKYRDDIISIV